MRLDIGEIWWHIISAGLATRRGSVTDADSAVGRRFSGVDGFAWASGMDKDKGRRSREAGTQPVADNGLWTTEEPA
jgi:hypothetical protein